MADSHDSKSRSFDQVSTPVPLSPKHQKSLNQFILFWGEMASKWGINRTMAQIHALLYAMETPLDTDEIMNRLQISRGNASMNLRSLLQWKLIRKIDISGSRRDYYTAEKDVWAITARIIKEREQREIKPVKEQLLETRCILTGGPENQGSTELTEQEQYLCERIDRLVELMTVFEGFSNALLPYIEARNASLIQKLIGFAKILPVETDRNSENQ